MKTHPSTPGIYVKKEEPALRSNLRIASAIPAFVGFTANTHLDVKSHTFKAIRIDSIKEYVHLFGERGAKSFLLLNKNYSFQSEPIIRTEKHLRFVLFEALQLFFFNGGERCYVVSLGNHKDSSSEEEFDLINQSRFNPDIFIRGIDALESEEEPTLLVVPEAVMLKDQHHCATVQRHMLKHCSNKNLNRFAILDIFDGYQGRSYNETDIIKCFRESIGDQYLNYGAAYYPWLHTSIIPKELIDFRSIANVSDLTRILKEELQYLNINEFRKREFISEVNRLEKKLNITSFEVKEIHETFLSISPFYRELMDTLYKEINTLPPSAALAGIYTSVDKRIGVWKSPSNMLLNEVISPTVSISQEDQEDLNMTTSGKSINAIRSFVNEGIVVWGGRTLDGNSRDLRYINVRRTLSYIEKYVSQICRSYVFKSNDTSTWQSLKGSISSFLINLWKSGGIVGSSSEQAYEISLGLGETMTDNDIIDGILRVIIKVAISRPMEYIIITYQQKMEEF